MEDKAPAKVETELVEDLLRKYGKPEAGPKAEFSPSDNTEG